MLIVKIRRAPTIHNTMLTIPAILTKTFENVEVMKVKYDGESLIYTPLLEDE